MYFITFIHTSRRWSFGPNLTLVGSFATCFWIVGRINLYLHLSLFSGQVWVRMTAHFLFHLCGVLPYNDSGVPRSKAGTTRPPSFILSLSLVCLVCFLIDGSQTGTKWNLWGPWHHFGPPSIHWQSLFCCKFVSGVYQARHLSDGYVSISFSNLSLMSPTIFYHITLHARCTLMN